MQDNANTDDVKLTAKEEMFCQQYILLLNATKAAINAGYSENSARVSGCRLLTKANIQKRIKQMQDDLEKSLEISKAWVLTQHKKIASANAGQLRDGWMNLKDFEALTEEQKEVIQEVTAKEGKFGTEVKVKLYDKQRSLDSISEMLGFFAPAKTELTGKDGKELFPQQTTEEKKAELEELLKQING